MLIGRLSVWGLSDTHSVLFGAAGGGAFAVRDGVQRGGAEREGVVSFARGSEEGAHRRCQVNEYFEAFRALTKAIA